MNGQDLLNMSENDQREYVHNFKEGAYKSFIKVRNILSRPGVCFTKEQIESINKLDLTGKQTAIIKTLAENNALSN